MGGASLHIGGIPRHLNGAMPPAVQALGIARHIRSEPEADPAALAHEMISLPTGTNASMCQEGSASLPGGYLRYEAWTGS